MKHYIISAVVVAALSTPAFAQVADKDYTVTISLSDLNTISDGLMQVPYGKAFPLINKLREQVLAQQPKPEPAKSPPAATPDTKDGSTPNKQP